MGQTFWNKATVKIWQGSNMKIKGNSDVISGKKLFLVNVFIAPTNQNNGSGQKEIKMGATPNFLMPK